MKTKTNEVANKMKYQDIQYLFWISFFQAFNAMADLREKELNELNITQTQALIISSIKDSNYDLNLSELSRNLGRKPHTTNEIIQRMIEKDLVIKMPSKIRRNGVILKLSPKGDYIRNKIREIKDIRRLISTLPQSQQIYLIKSFQLLRDIARNELAEFDFNENSVIL